MVQSVEGVTLNIRIYKGFWPGAATPHPRPLKGRLARRGPMRESSSVNREGVVLDYRSIARSGAKGRRKGTETLFCPAGGSRLVEKLHLRRTIAL